MTPESKSPHSSDQSLETLSPPTDPSAAPATKQRTLNTGGSTAVSLPAPPPMEVAGYEMLGELGHGGMGVVYKARQIKANRLVALKMILSGKRVSLEDRVRFQIETEAIARLQHPNIVQLYEVGEHEGLPYFSLEFCDGGTLAERLKSAPPAMDESAALVETLARAVHYAHLHGIVHRDLKPANVLLSGDAIPKIADFGLAKRLDAEGDSDVSKSGAIVGTPSYMAPEQAAGHTNSISPATDVYALGAILYELLAGRPPFKGETLMDTLQQVIGTEPIPPSRLKPGVPRDLETICLKCLRKEPSRRYTSADDLADDLRRYQVGEPIQARPVGNVERLVKWVKRKPGVASLLGALAVVLIAAFALVTWQLGETRAALGARDREAGLRQEADRKQSQARVATLLDAAPAAVPQVLADLEAVRDDVLPRLRELWQDKDTEPKRRMRAGLALLPVKPETVRDELAAWMLQVDDPAEVVLVRDALKPHGHLLKESLWTKTTDNSLKPPARFRALVALAAFDPDGERWAKQASAASDRLLNANPLYLGTWVEALRPVRGVLQGPLAKVYREATSPERREFAATVLADYAADRPDVLADLLLDADPKQYAVLFPVVQRSREQAVERFRRTVKGEEFWNDAPLDPSWREPDEEFRRAIESSDGILAERWALCQTLPLEKWSDVVEKLRACGYRPVRCRPWASGGRVPPELDTPTRIAAVWTRDGRAFHTEMGLTADAAKERDAVQQKAGFLPADVAGYGTDDKVRYAVLWVKPRHENEAARLYADVAEDLHKTTIDEVKNAGFIPRTLQSTRDENGVRHCGIWSKADHAPKLWNLSWNRSKDDHKGRILLAEQEQLLTDITVAEEQSQRQLRLAAAQFMQTDPLGIALYARAVFLPALPQFGTVAHGDPSREAEQTHGLSVFDNLERCRELAYRGYRPAAVSVTALDNITSAATVWHRPFPKQDERERLARRQATGAVSLLKLDAPSDVWPLYRHRPDPEARSQLIWRGGLLGLDPKRLVERLDDEKDISARRALILALGEFNGEQLPASLRPSITNKLLFWYRDDPDPGIHSAIDWLLRPDKEGEVDRPLKWGQATALKEIDESLKRRDPDDKRRWYVNSQGQTMVLIPGPVEFRMGAPSWDADKKEDETPHRRRIPRSFALGNRSVTVEEFQRFLKDRPDVRFNHVKRFSPDADGPIVGVTWFEAVQYCNWLSEKEGIPEKEWCYPRHEDIKEGMKPYPDCLSRKGYRLPSEAELEYAARAGSVLPRYYGSSLELLPRYAWFLANSNERAWPGGQKRPNDLGFLDIQGNVWNWANDPGFFYPKQQGITEILDGYILRDIDDHISRVLRGGSFSSRAPNVRSSDRSYYRPSLRLSIGLRLARTYH